MVTKSVDDRARRASVFKTHANNAIHDVEDDDDDDDDNDDGYNF